MPYSLPGQIVIDNSADDFANEKVPERIFNLNPGMKLILAVRNPVERALSEYTMHKMNYERRNMTAKLVKQWIKQGEPFPPFELIWEKYLYMFYDAALENWLKYFKLKQIHIEDSVILRDRPLQVMKQIE